MSASRFRYQRTCFVNVGQAPANIWRTYKAGGYAPISSYEEAVKGRVVRFGAYDDPAFMPIKVVANLLMFAKGHTGYTQQWFQEFAADYRGIFMASVDSAIEEGMAQSQGWKTFRVFAPDAVIEGSKTCLAHLKALSTTGSATQKAFAMWSGACTKSSD